MMDMTKDFLTKTSLSALAISAGLALSATSADALTVTFTSSGGATKTFTDNVLVGLDGDLQPADDEIVALGFTLGGFTLGNFTAFAVQVPGESLIQTTSLIFSGGNAGETMTVETSGFGFNEGADSPKASRVSYALGGSSLAGDLAGFGEVTPLSDPVVVTDTLSFNTADNGTGGFSADADSLDPVDKPFDLMTSVTVGAQSGSSNVNTRVSVTTIPLPAGGLLLLSALGGVALLRGRRKTA